MCKLFDDWSHEIEQYCKANQLDFEKAKRLSQCWGKDFVALQHFDSNSKSARLGLGLRDETPMPVVLVIRKTPKGLHFEQTDNTKKYLS